ncbi:hypothetical protein ABZ722_33970 [Streptomyces longwoodensis]|uniref:hypothetical protein n=1 Tax=Streptomyces longwoodensis TaxID=68231 RepID=UPI0033D86AAB
MTEETRRCARPECVFGPEPRLTETGKLKISAWCSDACEAWFINALTTVRNDDPNAVDDVERQAHRLHLIGELLNLRAHPADMTFLMLPTAPLEEVTNA